MKGSTVKKKSFVLLSSSLLLSILILISACNSFNPSTAIKQQNTNEKPLATMTMPSLATATTENQQPTPIAQTVAATPTIDVTPTPEATTAMVVTIYPWDWPQTSDQPKVDFLPEALMPNGQIHQELFAEFLESSFTGMQADQTYDEKYRYLEQVKFVAYQSIWWQDNLCWNQTPLEIYEFQISSYYYASIEGAQRFMTDSSKKAGGFVKQDQPNRLLKFGDYTAKWECGAKPTSSELKFASIWIHLGNTASYFSIYSPSLSHEELEMMLSQFVDQYEKWLSTFAVPLTENVRFEVPIELAHYNDGTSASASGASTFRGLIGTWQKEEGRDFLFGNPLSWRHVTTFSFYENGQFIMEFASDRVVDSLDGSFARTECKKNRFVTGNWRVETDKVMFYPSTITQGQSAHCVNAYLTNYEDVVSIEPHEVVVASVSFQSTSSTTDDAVKMELTLCNQNDYTSSGDADMFVGCIEVLIKQ